MSDFEDRVRSALGSASESAPPADGLAPAARGRLRKRRRTTFVAVAAALVVAAIPTGLAIANGGGRSDLAPPVATEPPSATPDEGWRWESYRDVELQVPDRWGYGGGSDWCVRADDVDSVTPQVTRPNSAVYDIGCFPQYAYGVLFDSSAAVDLAHPSGSVWQYGDEGVYPDGAWLSIVVEDELAVTVVTRDQAMTSRIVESVRAIDGVDGNGCTPKLGEDIELRGQADQDSQMSICTYDDHGWLVRSERLSEQDTESALAALAAAPIRREGRVCAGTPDPRYGTVVMGFGHDLGSVSVVWESLCEGERGVFLSGVVRELTPDILYWALSPGWSGSVPDGVPTPDRLRR